MPLPAFSLANPIVASTWPVKPKIETAIMPNTHIGDGMTHGMPNKILPAMHAMKDHALKYVTECMVCASEAMRRRQMKAEATPKTPSKPTLSKKA